MGIPEIPMRWNKVMQELVPREGIFYFMVHLQQQEFVFKLLLTQIALLSFTR